MGIYSRNSTSLSDTTVIANESYHGVAGAYRILAECYENEHLLFESTIKGDFKVAIGINEGTILRSELQAIQEGAIREFFEKVIAMLKKLWEKIKGLFRNFIARITLFLNKMTPYLKSHKDKFMSKDIDKMPVKKWSKRTGDWPSPKGITDAVSNLKTTAFNLDKTSRYDDKSDLEEYLGKCIGKDKCTVAEFPKKARDYSFGEPKDYDNFKAAEINKAYIVGLLSNVANISRGIKTHEKKLELALKEATNIIKAAKAKVDKNSGDVEKTNIKTLQRTVSDLQTAISMYTVACISNTNFDIKQCRRIFIQAILYRAKTENGEIGDIVDEVDNEGDQMDHEFDQEVERMPDEYEKIEADKILSNDDPQSDFDKDVGDNETSGL